MSVPIYFTLSTKRKLKICTLLRISPLVTTLKTPFSSSPVISFYLDAVYYAGGISIFLINTSNSSIKKKMSDGAVTLTYFEYFLGHPWPHLTKAREAKVAECDLAAGFIEVISTRNTSVWGVSEEVASAGGTCVGARLSGIGSWLSIKEGFIDMLLNFIGPCNSSMIINLFCMLRRL